MSPVRRRAILLGGTFDPIHLGHLAVAEQAQAALAADEVWVIPAGVPPHRPVTAAPEDRLAMARAAAKSRPGWRVLDLELRRRGPSYTRDTVAELACARPAVEQWFLLGADAAREIGSWHRLDDLLDIVRFVVVNRGGVGELSPEAAAQLGFDPRRTRVVRVRSPEVSATEIRRRIATGESLDGLVPPGVAGVIDERKLYRPSNSPAGEGR